MGRFWWQTLFCDNSLADLQKSGLTFLAWLFVALMTPAEIAPLFPQIISNWNTNKKIKKEKEAVETREPEKRKNLDRDKTIKSYTSRLLVSFNAGSCMVYKCWPVFMHAPSSSPQAAVFWNPESWPLTDRRQASVHVRFSSCAGIDAL